jgi:hypothetical protein
VQNEHDRRDGGSPNVSLALSILHARAFRKDAGEVRWFSCDRTVRHANACSNSGAARVVTAIKI